jgi:hypothetical protein
MAQCLRPPVKQPVSSWHAYPNAATTTRVGPTRSARLRLLDVGVLEGVPRDT